MPPIINDAHEACALAQHITDQLLPANPDGGTYDPRTNSFPTFSDEKTYLVSVPGYEHRFHAFPTVERLVGWLKQVRMVMTRQHYFLGWWRDGNDWVFDISIAINGHREFIVGLAESWGQDAVFHPRSRQVIHVPHERKQAA